MGNDANRISRDVPSVDSWGTIARLPVIFDNDVPWIELSVHAKSTALEQLAHRFDHVRIAAEHES